MRYFGVGVPSRTNVAERRIPEAGAAAREATVQSLRKVPFYQVSFDGGKSKYCEDSTKMVGVCGNMPKGGSVFMGVINTRDETLDAERCVHAGPTCACRSGPMSHVSPFSQPHPLSLPPSCPHPPSAAASHPRPGYGQIECAPY